MTTPPTRRMRLEMVDESTNCVGLGARVRAGVRGGVMTNCVG